MLAAFVPPTTGEVVKQLQRTDLFADLRDRDFEELVCEAEAQPLTAGEELWRVGEGLSSLVLVFTGLLKVSLGGHELRTVREGQLVGRSMVLGGGPATADLHACHRTVVIHLPREAVNALADAHPIVWRRTVRHLSGLIKALTTELQNAQDKTRDSDQRILAWFRSSADEDGLVTDASAQDIADELGIDPNTINGSKRRLEDSGKIERPQNDQVKVVGFRTSRKPAAARVRLKPS